MHEEVLLSFGFNGEFRHGFEEGFPLEPRQSRNHFCVIFLELFIGGFALLQQRVNRGFALQSLHSQFPGVKLDPFLLDFVLQKLLIFGFEHKLSENVSVLVNRRQLLRELESQRGWEFIVAHSH